MTHWNFVSDEINYLLPIHTVFLHISKKAKTNPIELVKHSKCTLIKHDNKIFLLVGVGGLGVVVGVGGVGVVVGDGVAEIPYKYLLFISYYKVETSI